MITSYEQLLRYLEADRVALNRKPTLRSKLFDEIWKFQRLMRELEYAINCNKSKLVKAFLRYRYQKQSQKLGYTIPINVFGPGLSIAHQGTIVVNGAARVGRNCRLHVCVNIGTEAGKSGVAPKIGDNCYIGPGAKIFGDIIIGPNTVIGANAVVNKSFPEGNITIGGIPAKVISNKSSAGLIILGDRNGETAQGG